MHEEEREALEVIFVSTVDCLGRQQDTLPLERALTVKKEVCVALLIPAYWIYPLGAMSASVCAPVSEREIALTQDVASSSLFISPLKRAGSSICTSQSS